MANPRRVPRNGLDQIIAGIRGIATGTNQHALLEQAVTYATGSETAGALLPGLASLGFGIAGARMARYAAQTAATEQMLKGVLTNVDDLAKAVALAKVGKYDDLATLLKGKGVAAGEADALAGVLGKAERGVAAAGGSAAAILYEGDASTLINGLRASKSRWLNRVADRVENLENVKLLSDAEFAEAIRYYRMSADTTSIYTDSGQILLKRSRGYEQLVRDLAHEGTHAMDFRQVGKGIFAGETPSLQFGEEAFLREFRGYYAERLVDRHVKPMTVSEYNALVRMILKKYPGSVKPNFVP